MSKNNVLAELTQKALTKAFDEPGATVKSVANNFGISTVTCYHYMDQWGIESPKKRAIRRMRKRVLQLYRGKASMLRVAKKLDVSEATARYFLVRAIGRRWNPKRAKVETLPRPQAIDELKIVHALDDGIPLHTEKLMKHTGLGEHRIEMYIGRIKNARAKG